MHVGFPGMMMDLATAFTSPRLRGEVGALLRAG